MAKDPAFLFYSNDFISGTQFFTDEEVGIYIRLLCAQHQHGRLHEKHMLIICKTLDSDVLKKFTKDSDGLYYNERLENEINRRKKYSESRSNNRTGKVKTTKKKHKNISLSYDNHMETETVNENKDINRNKIPEFSEFLSYIKTLQPYKPELDFAIQSKYNAWKEAGWKDGNGKKIVNWKTKAQNTILYLKPMYPDKQTEIPIKTQKSINPDIDNIKY